MAQLPKLPRTASFIADRIYTAAEKRHERTTPKVRLSMGQIGDCERNLWAELHGIPNERPLDGRMHLLFEHGHAIEKLLVRDLKHAGFEVLDVDPETGRQFELSALEGKLFGYIDGQIILVKNPMLLEIKSANDKQYNLCVELGYEAWNPKYKAQLHVYMGCVGLGDALCGVVNKNTDDRYFEKVRFDPDIFLELMNKARRILDAEEILPRPAQAKTQYCAYCKWCNRNQWCWSPVAEKPFDD